MQSEEIEMKVEGVELKRQFLQSSQPFSRIVVWYHLVQDRYWVEFCSCHEFSKDFFYNTLIPKTPQWATIKKFIETYERLQ